ncbi:phenylacetyl-CoA ligase [Punctularia strigosozonata HHB-11173 SS5]|uniref:phenylacetyl-CoA ligase n=1 Tax=Punctularia strigosozonata (strain HHB-11173) TaxID=741275 RepID=UPI0004418615|nr:phenylacetyl-CoA ligase [Punctularia strigosozonata HHB-11173 SS5]EIN14039.1 phenylacetyl-CoA ligase [Punctularia strigosozonata HHB-11173 SS5]
MDFEVPGAELPHVPDNLTIPQFLLDSQHATRPLRPVNSPWLIEDETGRHIGFEELRRRTFGLANALSVKYGIGNNDVVCLFSPNHVDYPVVVWAIHRLGAIISPANPAYTVEELVYQCQASKSSMIMVHPLFLSTALSAARQANISSDRIVLVDSLPTSTGTSVPIHCPPTVSDLVAHGLSEPLRFKEPQLSTGGGKTKLAFLSFSSGTTGRPKAVAIPHYAVIANVIQMAKHWKINEDYTTWEERQWRAGDVAIAVLPFFHIYGLVVNLHYCLFAGLSIVVVPKFNFENFLASIARYRVTHLLLVPPQMVLFCKHPATKKYDFSHVRLCMAGAAPVSSELTMQFTKVMKNAYIGQGYGMTETSTTVAVLTPDQKLFTLGSAGKLMPGVTARVIKEDGSLGGVNDVGELVVASPSNALRYENNPEATKETFMEADGKRWVRTGDEVRINEKYELFIVDRIKELIKVRGFQVAPAELEGHLLDHRDVSDACVVGIPHEYSGEVPLAFVVLSSDAASKLKQAGTGEVERLKKSIMKHVADAKVHYKHLYDVEIVSEIPKNPSGKLLRRLLRDRARQARAKVEVTKAKL